jgi:iron complex outermembrane receptor protein
MSKDALYRLGWDWGGYASDWNTAVSRAYCQVSPQNAASRAGCVSTGAAGDKASEAYGFTGGQILRDDDLYYVAGDFSLSDTLTARAQVYKHTDKGAGNVWNHGWSSGNTVPWIIRNTGYAIDRHGALASLAWDVGVHRLQAGFWLEDNKSSAVRYQYTQVTGPVSLAHYLTEQPDAGVFAQETDWDTKQFYLQDSLHLLDDALVIDAGFKSTNAVEDATAVPGIAKTPIPANSSGQFATGSLRAKDRFLPQVGARWRIAPGHEVYASYAQNIAMFQGGFKLGPMAVSQAVWDSQGGATLDPETSNAREVGYRFVGDAVQATVAAYDVSFGHRLLQYNPCNSRAPNGPGCGNKFYNVGGVKSRGVELGVLWQPLAWLSWYNSASFNKSTYNDDYVQADVLYRTGGKQQVDTPKQMFASVLTLKQGGFRASLQGKFTGRRYYTYTNDQSFGGFTTVDLSGGYDFGSFGVLRNVKLALNVTNLTDKRTVSNLDSSVFAPVDPNGTIVVAHANAPRQIFGTVSLAF